MICFNGLLCRAVVIKLVAIKEILGAHTNLALQKKISAAETKLGRIQVRSQLEINMWHGP